MAVFILLYDAYSSTHFKKTSSIRSHYMTALSAFLGIFHTVLEKCYYGFEPLFAMLLNPYYYLKKVFLQEINHLIPAKNFRRLKLKRTKLLCT